MAIYEVEAQVIRHFLRKPKQLICFWEDKNLQQVCQAVFYPCFCLF